MASKYVYIAKLYDSISKEVARSPEDWKAFLIKSKTTGYACGSKELIAMRRKKPPFVTIELVCQPEK